MLVAPVLLVVLAQPPAPSAHGPSVSALEAHSSSVACRRAHLRFVGAGVDRVLDRAAIERGVRAAGLEESSADDAQLTLTFSADPGSVRSAPGGYYQTCLRGAATLAHPGAPQPTTLAESCPQSGTELTPEFARRGAEDLWTEAARAQLTRRVLSTLDAALESLANGVSIDSAPRGATVVLGAELAEGEPRGGRQLGPTPVVLGCMARDELVAGVLTRDGYEAAVFRLTAASNAAQAPVTLTAVREPPAGAVEEIATGPAPTQEPGEGRALGGALVGALLAATLVLILGFRRSRADHRGGPPSAGRYELLERLGSGGMGEVWKARHTLLERSAAVKLVRGEILGGSREAIDHIHQRFEREAKATAALRSPHTIELYDYGTTDDGSFYYAMEILSGLELHTLVQRFGPVPASRMIHLVRQACAALDEAHAAGLVHRDIKPANIFASCLGTSFDFVKVLDFGVVKSYGEQAATLTQTQVMVGTPAFAAPEMITRDGRIDGRADIYALGCVAYWLLTGTLVFDGDDVQQVLYRHVNAEPDPPSRRTELTVPAGVEAVVLRCLAKDPALRFQRAAELATALGACACAVEWTPERAEAWWRQNAPSHIRDATPPGVMD